MATPVDGPDLSPSDYTWESKFGHVIWNGGAGEDNQNATTEQDTLLFTGGVNYFFQFFSGFETNSYLTFEPLVSDGTTMIANINEDYQTELVGYVITPKQTGDDPFADPCPPQVIDPLLFVYDETYFQTRQPVTNNTSPRYWYFGIDSIDGFNDYGPTV